VFEINAKAPFAGLHGRTPVIPVSLAVQHRGGDARRVAGKRRGLQLPRQRGERGAEDHPRGKEGEDREQVAIEEARLRA
jgi:hypothetical protein